MYSSMNPFLLCFPFSPILIVCMSTRRVRAFAFDGSIPSVERRCATKTLERAFLIRSVLLMSETVFE